MPLEIIGAGFGRTGTHSTWIALKQLGFPCYHMFEVFNPANSHHLDFWHEVARSAPGTAHDWERVFAGFRATVDNPGCCVWEALLAAYPDARVLLTLHPKGPDAWYESTIETIYFTESSWQFKLLALFFPARRKFAEMSHHLIWQRSHRGTMRDRKAAIAHYLAHIEDVKAKVPPERLLIFSADQGWEPLCRFLGVPVPAEPFPNGNDRATMKQFISKIARTAYWLLAGMSVVVIALVWALLHWLG